MVEAGLNPVDQKGLDDFLLKLDGTPNKGNLGANAILGVSMAACKAAAAAKVGRPPTTPRPALPCTPIHTPHTPTHKRTRTRTNTSTVLRSPLRPTDGQLTLASRPNPSPPRSLGQQGVPLYKHIADLAGFEKVIMPVPSFNVINGGSHAGNALAMQEFMIFPTGTQLPVAMPGAPPLATQRPWQRWWRRPHDVLFDHSVRVPSA